MKNIESIDSEAVSIVLTLNEDFFGPMGVLLQSIYKHASENRLYDIVVFYIGLDDEMVAKITNWCIDKSNFNVRFYNVCDYAKDIPFLSNPRGKEVWYRFLPLWYMPDYSKIIYIDCDTMVRVDLAKLYDIDLTSEGNYVAAVEDICGNWEVYATNNDVTGYRRNKLQMANPGAYFNAGMLLMDLELMRACETFFNLWEFVKKNGPFVRNDQDVLNMLCVNKVHWLPYEWNFIKQCDPGGLSFIPIDDKARWLEAERNPLIIHYTGTYRPWLQYEEAVIFSNEYWTTAVASVTFNDCLKLNVQKCSNEQVKKNMLQGKGVGVKYILELIKIYLNRKAKIRK